MNHSSLHEPKNILTVGKIDEYRIVEHLRDEHDVGIYKAQLEGNPENKDVLYEFKVFKTSSPKKDYVTLRKESSYLREIQHPSVARFFKYGLGRIQEQDLLYSVSEFVSGKTLQQMFDATKKGTSMDGALPWAYALCEGIQYLHECKISHGVLHPENCVLFWTKKQGRSLQILGLDMAYFRQKQHEANHHFGKFEYLSPEQFSHRGTLASDVYTVGLILYQIVSSSYPYVVSGNPDVIEWRKLHCEQTPRPLDGLNTVPEKVAQMIMRCLEKKPSHRPTIQELTSVLAKNVQTKSTPSYISFLGHRASGKTCYFTSLYSEAQCSEETQKQLKKNYINLYQHGILPDATAMTSSYLEFTLHRNQRSYNLLTKDYAGELLNANEQNLSNDIFLAERSTLYDFFQYTRAICIIIETKPTKEANVSEFIQYRDSILALLGKAMTEDNARSLVQVPIALVLTKWDRMGNVSQDPAQEKERAIQYLMENSQYRKLYEFLQQISTAFEVFPVYCFVGDKPLPNQSRVFNIYSPLLWAVDQADRTALKRCIDFEKRYPDQYQDILENYLSLLKVDKVGDPQIREQAKTNLGNAIYSYYLYLSQKQGLHLPTAASSAAANPSAPKSATTASKPASSGKKSGFSLFAQSTQEALIQIQKYIAFLKVIKDLPQDLVKPSPVYAISLRDIIARSEQDLKQLQQWVARQNTKRRFNHVAAGILVGLVLFFAGQFGLSYYLEGQTLKEQIARVDKALAAVPDPSENPSDWQKLWLEMVQADERYKTLEAIKKDYIACQSKLEKQDAKHKILEQNILRHLGNLEARQKAWQKLTARPLSIELATSLQALIERRVLTIQETMQQLQSQFSSGEAIDQAKNCLEAAEIKGCQDALVLVQQTAGIHPKASMAQNLDSLQKVSPSLAKLIQTHNQEVKLRSEDYKDTIPLIQTTFASQQTREEFLNQDPPQLPLCKAFQECLDEFQKLYKEIPTVAEASLKPAEQGLARRMESLLSYRTQVAFAKQWLLYRSVEKQAEEKHSSKFSDLESTIEGNIKTLQNFQTEVDKPLSPPDYEPADYGKLCDQQRKVQHTILQAIENSNQLLEKIQKIRQQCKDAILHILPTRQQNPNYAITPKKSYKDWISKLEALRAETLRNPTLSPSYEKALGERVQWLTNKRENDSKEYYALKNRFENSKFFTLQQEIENYKNNQEHDGIMQKDLEKFQKEFRYNLNVEISLTPQGCMRENYSFWYWRQLKDQSWHKAKSQKIPNDKLVPIDTVPFYGVKLGADNTCNIRVYWDGWTGDVLFLETGLDFSKFYNNESFTIAAPCYDGKQRQDGKIILHAVQEIDLSSNPAKFPVFDETKY